MVKESDIVKMMVALQEALEEAYAPGAAFNPSHPGWDKVQAIKADWMSRLA